MATDRKAVLNMAVCVQGLALLYVVQKSHAPWADAAQPDMLSTALHNETWLPRLTSVCCLAPGGRHALVAPLLRSIAPPTWQLMHHTAPAEMPEGMRSAAGTLTSRPTSLMLANRVHGTLARGQATTHLCDSPGMAGSVQLPSRPAARPALPTQTHAACLQAAFHRGGE